MGLSRQEYWSGLPFPSPEDDLPGPGIKPTSLMSPVLAGRFFTSSATWEATTDPWVGLKNTMVSERSQAGKTGYYMIPLHEASRKSKATDTESRRRVAWGWSGEESKLQTAMSYWDVPGGPVVENPPINAGNTSLIPGRRPHMPQPTCHNH